MIRKNSFVEMMNVCNKSLFASYEENAFYATNKKRKIMQIRKGK